jgi:hypothetical protein
MADVFEHASRRVREHLAPCVARVTARHRDAPLALCEPPAPMGVWFAIHDGEGSPLVLVSAHADAVNFLLGKRGFLYYRETATTPLDRLVTWFEETLDAALSGGLHVDGDRATLQTRSGPVPLVWD